MGTPADKLTYLNETKKDLKQAINSFGGDIDDNTTFRNYTEPLHDLYDNAPKTDFQEGTSITLTDCIKAKIAFDETSDGKEIACIGQSEQDTSSGYNLLELNPTTLRAKNVEGTWVDDSTYLYNGFTFTINYDTGKVIVSGTGETTTVFSIPITLTQGGTYRVSGYVNDGAVILANEDFTQYVRAYSSGAVLENAISTDYDYNIRVVNGPLPENAVFEPMVIEGTEPKPFEKHTSGGDPSPSHETPIQYVTGNVEEIVTDENDNIIATYPLSLGTMKMCGIGDNRDYFITDRATKKWYKRKVITEITYDGTETGWAMNSLSGGKKVFQIANSDYKEAEGNICLCNYFKSVVNGSFSDMENNTCRFRFPVPDTGCIYICTDIASSENDFKTWLSNHNVTVYYALETPIDIEITDTTLKTQLENWYNGQTIEEITTISGSGNLPMVIKARALTEIQAKSKGTLEINLNGTYDVSTYEDVDVDVAGQTPSGTDVIFYDYDGSVAYSYSKSDFLALTSMPANPTHTGLTSQGWNWSLEDAQTYVTTYDKLNIGQMYVTDNGETRLYIELDEPSTPYLGIGVNGTCTIDWGDGYTEDVSGVSVQNNVAVPHSYLSAGSYVLKIIPTNTSTFGILGANSGSTLLYKSGANKARTYINSIKKIELGANINFLSNYALAYCGALEYITIPNNISSLGTGVFQYCSSLKSITVPSGATRLNTFMCDNCINLTSIAIPKSVTAIDSYALQNCRSLETLTLPDNITQIGTYSMGSCYGLKEVIIPVGISTIPSNAFSSCFLLENITIPNGVTSIGSYAFSQCHLLKNITIPSSVTSIGGYAFYWCFSLESIEIPNGVTSIQVTTFQNCYSLKNITIPDSVTSIGAGSFQGCWALNSVAIPNGVTSIEGNVFREAYSLSNITGLGNITHIGTYAFQSCYSMSVYDFSQCASIPTLANSNAFSNMASDCQILVPSSLYNDWVATSPWSSYASHIVPV